MASENRPNEWKIEQGRSGAELPVLDQSGRETRSIPPEGQFQKFKDEAALEAVGDPIQLFAEELEGWKG
jgi:sulfite oxidase